jgi:membrane protease YdiL (CAAX protease family)
MLISLLISAFLQLLVFCAVPFAVYAIARRTARGFPAYIGLTRPTTNGLLLAAVTGALFIAVMFALMALGPEMHALATGPDTVPGKLRLIGPSSAGIAALLITAVIQTSLAEELLFRGFLAKRLIAALGFWWGNALQAGLFGGMHLLLFAGSGGAAFSPALAACVVGATGLIGGLLCYINEQRANGSIVPGWLAHGATNVISYALLAFA